MALFEPHFPLLFKIAGLLALDLSLVNSPPVPAIE